MQGPDGSPESFLSRTQTRFFQTLGDEERGRWYQHQSGAWCRALECAEGAERPRWWDTGQWVTTYCGYVSLQCLHSDYQ